MPDYYDYFTFVGPDGGVGGFDMMDANAGDHNCLSKWMLDWLTPAVVSGDRQELTLDDTATSTDAVLIWPGADLGNIFSEFFMVQNKQHIGNDTTFWFQPDGLAIWHVDATLNTLGTDFKYNNSYTEHKFLRLMESDGLEEIETGSGWADSDDLYNVGDEIGPDTAPSSDKYDGTDSCIRVWNISDLGTTPGAEISASLQAACMQPTPDIKANAQDGPITISAATPVSITVSLDPGDYAGQYADWWLEAATPAGTYSYVYSPSGGSWLPGTHPIVQTGLLALYQYEVLNRTLPWVGDYTLNFGVDNNADGIPDLTWSDSVDIHVTP